MSEDNNKKNKTKKTWVNFMFLENGNDDTNCP